MDSCYLNKCLRVAMANSLCWKFACVQLLTRTWTWTWKEYVWIEALDEQGIDQRRRHDSVLLSHPLVISGGHVVGTL